MKIAILFVITWIGVGIFKVLVDPVPEGTALIHKGEPYTKCNKCEDCLKKLEDKCDTQTQKDQLP